MGNGQGFFTEIPQFGLPAGGQFDTRVDFYFGDNWKVRHNLTVTAGLHYGRDTGRADSDLPAIPQLAAFNNQFFQNLQGRSQPPEQELRTADWYCLGSVGHGQDRHPRGRRSLL